MADSTPGGLEGLKAGGHARPDASGPQDVAKTLPQGTTHSGPAPGTQEYRHAHSKARMKRNVGSRQRRQVRELSKMGDELLKRADCGAGSKGSPAAAFGTVTRALREVHEMERAQFGLDESQVKQVAIILLPVAASDMDAWQRESVRVLGSVPRQDKALEVRPGYRVIEDDVIGEAASE
jgi:hypothetical protein